jgi:hypothetical protein
MTGRVDEWLPEDEGDEDVNAYGMRLASERPWYTNFFLSATSRLLG